MTYNIIMTYNEVGDSGLYKTRKESQIARTSDLVGTSQII
jgi:hypothetical protein